MACKMGEVCYYLRHGIWSIITGLLSENEPVDPQEKAFVEKLLWNAAANPYTKR
jgi:hypothetical protein